MGFHANREEISAKCPHRSDEEVICSMSCINPPILWTDHPWLNFHNLKRENVTLSHGGDTNSGKDSITLIMVVSQAVNAQQWVCIWRTKYYKIYFSNFSWLKFWKLLNSLYISGSRPQKSPKKKTKKTRSIAISSKFWIGMVYKRWYLVNPHVQTVQNMYDRGGWSL